jgi:hypothetical protein
MLVIMSGQEPGSLIVRITGLLLGQRQCERPKVRIWYGPFKLRFRMIDAIDYYEEKLRKIDESDKSPDRSSSASRGCCSVSGNAFPSFFGRLYPICNEHVLGYSNERPKVRIWYGPFKLRFRMIDAIDYYASRGCCSVSGNAFPSFFGRLYPICFVHALSSSRMIPHDLGTEDKIKEFVEGLRVGKVESITVCRKWRESAAMHFHRSLVACILYVSSMLSQVHG